MIPVLGGAVGAILGEQFSDDFDYTIGGGLPAGFTERANVGGSDDLDIEAALVAGSVSGKDLAWEVSSGTVRCVTFDAPGNSNANAEILVNMYFEALPDPTGTSTGAGLWLRFDGTFEGSDYTGYVSRVQTEDDVHFLEIRRYENGGGAALIDRVQLAGLAVDTRYYWRFRAHGQNLMAKLWEIGDPEPDWMVETTDGNITAPGYAGLFQFSGRHDPRFAWISVGTKGAVAPLPP